MKLSTAIERAMKQSGRSSTAAVQYVVADDQLQEYKVAFNYVCHVSFLT